MQKMREELNANVVGANSVRPHFEGMTLNNQKGITLIALIITIIVMLILVGVTINVALNGGLFSKAEEAGAKTKIAQIQEALTIKKAEVLADKNGEAPEDYGITLDKLNIPAQLKTEYESKLIISKDGKLYYDATVVTNKEEQDAFKSMGIQPYVETPVPTRVPFANYIERGNNYYIKGDKTSSSYEVVTFSETGTFTIYEVNNGQVSEKQDFSEINFKIIDKNESETLGYTVEMIEQGTGIPFDEVNDDIIIWGEEVKIGNVFKSNYTQVIITTDWYTLDTTYQFPS